MAVETIFAPSNMSADTDRGPSGAIWGDCPWSSFDKDPASGMRIWDDFILSGSNTSAAGGAFAGSSGQWATYIYQGGTVTDGALEGGVRTIQSDGDNEGVSFSSAAGAFRLVTTSTLALNQQLWFEARVSLSTVTATKNDTFIGLFDNSLSSGLPAAAIPISTTDDTLSTTPNILGFFRKGTAAPTDWQFVYQLASGSPVFPTGLTTLATTVLGAALTAGQWVKLGFRFNPSAVAKYISVASTGQTAGQLARPLIQVYVNGLPAPAFLTSTNLGGGAFPTGFMSPGFAIMNQTASSPGSSSVDWIRVAQVANS